MALALSLFSKGLLITSGAVVVASVTGYYYKDQLGSVLSKIIPTREPEAENNNKDLNEKIKALGITDSECLLKNQQTSVTCSLDVQKLKNINFPEKEDGEELPVSGLEGNKKVTLKIEKGYETSDFAHGLRLTFTNPNNPEVTIGKTDSTQKILKPNVGYDYYIQSSDETKIMDAWTLQKLGGKVGLTIDDSQNNVCNLNENQNNKVNVWKSETEYVIGADANRGGTCQMDVQKDTAGYLEGFKFTVKGESDITLTGGTGPDGGTTINKIIKENNPYEIGVREVDGTKKWFLIDRKNTQ